MPPDPGEPDPDQLAAALSPSPDDAADRPPADELAIKRECDEGMLTLERFLEEQP
jgi:hypothetical protein